MYSRKTTVKNSTGLHARPAAAFINFAKTFASDISISRANEDNAKACNAKSMLTLMTLAIACGEDVEITGNGPDETAAVDALIEFLDNKCGIDD